MEKIFLGIITGTHGRPSDRGQKYKVTLHSISSPYLAELQYAYFSSGSESFKIEFHDSLQPSGGKWGQAQEILVLVPHGVVMPRSAEMHIDRSQLPPLAEGEFLVADFVGFEVFNGTGTRVGRVVGAEDAASLALHRNHLESVNLVIEQPSRKTFSVPIAWISKEQIEESFKTKKIIVEDIEQWMSLETAVLGEERDDD